MALAGRASVAEADSHVAVFERIPVPAWVYDPETLAFVSVNDAAIERYGYTREEFLAMTLRDIRPPEDVDRVERHVAAGGGDPEGVWCHVTSKGQRFDVQVATSDVMFEGRTCRVVVAEDVTERLRTQEQLAGRAAMQAAVASLGVHALEGMEVGALMDEAAAMIAATLGADIVELLEMSADRESLRLRAGAGWREGLVREALVPIGSHYHSGFVFGSSGRVVIEDFTAEERFAPTPVLAEHGARSGAAVIVGRRGHPYGVLGAYATGLRSFSGDELDFMQSVANVVADAIGRHAAEEQIRHQALHDPLTALPNRTLLMDRLSHWLGQARRRNATGALFFLDLDGFKLVNDALGHETGDALLSALARRLADVVRPTDTVARVGGDEFVIFCEDIGSELAALEVVERLLASLERPFAATGPDRRVTASVGVALADHRSDADTLIRSADAAMYRAKERGGERFEVFDDEMRERSVRWLEIERDLREAVEDDAFHNLYQPIVTATDAPGAVHVVGFEALVRWDHPQRGVIRPDEFIPVAEQTGLIIPIGERVLARACEQAAAWQPVSGEPGLEIAVNLSPRQFSHPGLVPSVAAALERTGLDPTLLSLEITETVLIDNADLALHTLQRLKDLGVRLVLDDFGTGYSSLSHLKRFPIDLVKIDRSFVDGLGDDAGDSAIVSAVISMGLAMGVGIVAEGVETAAQAATLRALGCPLAQGFLFARPLDAEAAGELMGAAGSVVVAQPS
jgi:diguanylate cyclase (GGDEF)-like protein/PAS domain S-box-containing protein